MLNQLFWIVPICSVIALIFAFFFFKGMMRESEGNDTMKRIAGHVRKGAMAYLKQQYKVVSIVFLVLCIFFAWMAYGPGLQNGRSGLPLALEFGRLSLSGSICKKR